MQEKEIWKDIQGYEGLYQVSNLGNVKNKIQPYLKQERIKKSCKQYLVKIPNGEIVKVTNLDKFARENNLTSGTLHSTFKKNKPTKGFQVIKRI